MKNTFETIILIGRPAAGKSEVIDFLKKTPVEQRRRRFHIGAFEEIDDFSMSGSASRSTRSSRSMAASALFTTSDNYFKEHFSWKLLDREA